MNDHSAANDGSRFPKTVRLRKSSEFKAVYDLRCKASDGTLLVFAGRNPDGKTRLGLSVSRKLGNAVQRNRLKRLLREAFRLCRKDLPAGIDLVVIPQGTVRAGLIAYRESLLRLSRKLHRRLISIVENAAASPSVEQEPSA